MHRSEDYDRVLCLQCGSDVSASRDRAYPIGGDDALCFRCALERGGRYDENHDRWSEAPQLDGLPNRRLARRTLALLAVAATTSGRER